MKARWLWLILWACLAPQGLAALEVHLLVTSDQHGWLSSSELFPGRKRFGLLHLEPHIRAVRALEPEALLLDGGDAVQGSPLVTWAHEESPRNNPFTRKLQDLGYVAMAVGNHDLETNPAFEAYDQALPWLAANVTRQGKLVFVPYKMVTVKGVKIALLGLTTPGVRQWLSPQRLQGLEVQDMIAAAKYWVPQVRQAEHPDLVIALLHAGLDPKRDDAVSKLNRQPLANASYRLLHEVEGIDLAVTGHDHRRIPFASGPLPKVNQTYVVGGDSHGQSLIQVKLELSQQQRTWKIAHAQAWVHLPSADPQIDRAYQQSLSPAYRAWLARPTGWYYLGSGLKKLNPCVQQLQADAVLAASTEPPTQGSALPWVATGGIRSKEMITWRQVLAWVPYDNDLELLRLNLRQLQILGQERDVHLDLTRPLPPAENGWLLPRQDFIQTKNLVLGSYHVAGGAGVAGAMLLQPEQRLLLLPSSLRSRLFDFMRDLKDAPLPCQGVISRNLPPKQTKAHKAKQTKAKTGKVKGA